MNYEAIQQHISELSPTLKILAILIISAIPIIEQRVSIPIGIALGIHPVIVLIVALIGSLIPVPFILLLFNIVYEWMRPFRVFKPIIHIIDHKIRKNTPKIEKYKEIGLITFVAIPLPTTGLWTGSLVAAVMGLNFKKSFICAAIGALISAIVMTILSLTVGHFF